MLTDIGTYTATARVTDEREREIERKVNKDNELYNRKLRISRASQIKAGTDVITHKSLAALSTFIAHSKAHLRSIRPISGHILGTSLVLMS